MLGALQRFVASSWAPWALLALTLVLHVLATLRHPAVILWDDYRYRTQYHWIERYLRPVCYQDVPKSLLPSAIADGNPDNIWRRVDGQLTQD